MILSRNSLLVAVTFAFTVSCAKTTTPDTPWGVVSIAYLKSKYKGAALRVTEELKIEGIVVSSDQWGNFYKTLVIQDATGGIEIKLNSKELHDAYPVGCKIKVSCSGLTLGSYGGTLQLGARGNENYQTDYIPKDEMAYYIKVIRQEIPLEAVSLTIPALLSSNVNTFVRICGVQFAQLGVPWSNPDADTDRHLIDRSGNKLIVRTSSRANFASYTLPAGSGEIEGVLGYFNGTYQLLVLSAYDGCLSAPRF